MVWLGTSILLALAVAYLARRDVRRRRTERLEQLRRFRLSCRAAIDDLDTLADLSGLEEIEEARRRVRTASAAGEVTSALQALRQACPDLDPPCALDPGHGPADHELAWGRDDDDRQRVGVCAGCAAPDGGARSRLVRRGDRLVPWFAAGPAYDAYASGWFDTDLDAFRAAAAELVAWDQGTETTTAHLDVKMGAGWYGVLLAANHRQGKFSSG